MLSNSVQPHGLQHARLSCPLSPGVCTSSYPLSWWCYLTISSFAAHFSFYLLSFPASGSFLMSWLFALGGQSVGASASASSFQWIFMVEMATHSSIHAWKIPWTEEPGGLQSMGSQRVRHDWATSVCIWSPCMHLILLNIMKLSHR